ncbi:hypothetical protein RO3G_09172 [Rhizopus delemar RA 99-880]|uniref:Uncharacterized protein n=1 Tax=Rhizopus delemar (strain RA 99-880 / ATCC MYA-4621 / FGSC 9543 / NRRL 43880) TaxID=246409 RepID=I1C7N2_RHIO9|nr:hypothetical protein RO3G_09172 [Rhizopus delemar RA 99-880]|eukprot:EIE84462.1 hypothetical protein RO3G_09172 [Rhizopus delemar RA 99-880]
MNANYRPALIDFHGYEGEDFRHFVESLESYFAINNITQEPRKLIILKAQLRGAAKVYYEKEILKRIPGINYEQAVDLLKNYYITPELIQSYELEFNEMYQGEQEHPQIFLARLKEATRTEAMDTDLPIQRKVTEKSNKPRTRRIEPDIKYDIISDVLKQKADIEIGDLITVAPSLRKKLVDECRPKRKSRQSQQVAQQTMALIEDEEINTTAAYSTRIRFYWPLNSPSLPPIEVRASCDIGQ